MRKRNKNKKMKGWVVAVLVITGFGMVGMGTIFSASMGTPNPANAPANNANGVNAPSSSVPAASSSDVLNQTSTELSTRAIALSCTTDALTQYHIHPHLQIFINGVEQVVPAGIGLTLTCMHPIHTHDDTGTIHVESPVARDFTLGDFFAVWGEPFSSTQIMNYQTDATHEITMTVDGRPSTDYENLVLQDGQQIVIQYKKVGS